MNFESLIGRITQVQDALQSQAAHAVNLSLTARNWLVGSYIVEFEQQGEDRAKYGENLLNNIAKSLSRKGLEARRLREYRQFYRVYPQLGNNVIDFLQKNAVAGLNVNDSQIWRLPTAKSKDSETHNNPIWQTASAKSQKQDSLQDGIWQLPTAKSSEEPWQTSAEWLYMHEMMQGDDNPPIGLLLCTDYGETTVRYATEGLSQNLFMSKYRLQLPSEEELRNYLLDNISEEDYKEYKKEQLDKTGGSAEVKN